MAGGGIVASQKAKAFLRCGARVTAVAPQFQKGFPKGAVRVRRAITLKDLNGAFLVCAATNDEPLNARIAAACQRKKIWVNVVDRPALCDFIVPAVLRRPPVTIAISTGGASPGFAKFLRQKLETFLKPNVIALGRRLVRERPAMKGLSMPKRRARLRRILQNA